MRVKSKVDKHKKTDKLKKILYKGFETLVSTLVSEKESSFSLLTSELLN